MRVSDSWRVVRGRSKSAARPSTTPRLAERKCVNVPAYTTMHTGGALLPSPLPLPWPSSPPRVEPPPAPRPRASPTSAASSAPATMSRANQTARKAPVPCHARERRKCGRGAGAAATPAMPTHVANAAHAATYTMATSPSARMLRPVAVGRNSRSSSLMPLSIGGRSLVPCESAWAASARRACPVAMTPSARDAADVVAAAKRVRHACCVVGRHASKAPTRPAARRSWATCKRIWLSASWWALISGPISTSSSREAHAWAAMPMEPAAPGRTSVPRHTRMISAQ
mmetsp:Transcript_21953/g.59185  ORF Transcript_21953/g.59185 Transcript_21953/m.59185 type:complete len:284 (+) Transcript_21953:3125-3976(+)